MNSISVAFKEWAVICHMLAAGQQSLILRKGGIAEPTGDFRVEHSRFWLCPTYVHQMDEGVTDSCRPFLHLARASQPPAGHLLLRHFAEVIVATRLTSLDQAHTLRGLHAWSDATIASRFAYRTPGLTAILVRVYDSGMTHDLLETEFYRGCKSWIELDQPYDTSHPSPVLDNDAFALAHKAFSTCLGTP